jgi:histidine triad (HIT) family protein
MSADDGCAFCAILAGRLPASFVLREPHVVAFVDLRQAVPGHVLVVPRRHVEDIYALDPMLAGELMRAAVRVARAVRDVFAPDGLNLWQSNGEAGGQEVPHVHLHVQPRTRGDGLLRVYAGQPALPDRETLDALAVRISGGLQASDGRS